MRLGCFKYFELGGEYVRGTISLLAGCVPQPSSTHLLANIEQNIKLPIPAVSSLLRRCNVRYLGSIHLHVAPLSS